MSRRLLLVVVLVAVAAGGAGTDGPSTGAQIAPASSSPPRDDGTLRLSPTPGPTPTLAESPRPDYLVDNTLHLASRVPVRLGTAPHPALQGTLSPLVAPSPNGAMVAFSTYSPFVALDPSRPPSQQGVHAGSPLGVPSVVLHDLRTGEERVVAEGAYSVAWRDALAFVQGSESVHRAGAPFTGQIVVRDSRDGEDVPWTLGGARSIVVAWAGPRLVYYDSTGSESYDIKVADGPGELRTLAVASSLVALSPDGARAAVATSANGGSSRVEIIDIGTGDVLASTDTGPRTSLVYGGSWVGNRLVARGGDERGPVAAVFEVGGGDVRLDKLLRVDPALPTGLVELRLDAANPNELAAWSFVPQGRSGGHYVLVRCQLDALICTSGPPIEGKVVRLLPGGSR